MDLNTFYAEEFDDHAACLVRTREAVSEPFARLSDISEKTIRSGNKIMFFGNGGSAADCQHLATELTIRYIKDRAAIAAIALTTDTSTLTAAGNDLGFDEIFSRQIEALGKPGDLAIGFSTSGNSENVIRALIKAKEMGITPAGFGGKDGGRMTEYADPFLIIPAETTRRIQEMHILIGHMLCGALEIRLGMV